MSDPLHSKAWRRLRQACFERDKARQAECWICHRPIDYGLGLSSSSGTPWAYEPDHRLPRKQYPHLALAPENIEPAHSQCNRRRRDRAALDEVGSRSRQW